MENLLFKMKTVENIAAEGEIAYDAKVFQKSSAAEASESDCMWERVNSYNMISSIPY